MGTHPTSRPRRTIDFTGFVLLAMGSLSIGLGSAVLLSKLLTGTLFAPAEWTPVVRIDPATNCQYLEGTWGQLTLRVDADGKPMCSR